MRVLSIAQSDLGLVLDPRRFVAETLQQISAHAQPAAAELVEVANASPEAVPAPAPKSGLLRKVLGRLGPQT